MFKDVSEVKEFIKWARSQQILVFKLGEVEVHFAPGASIDSAAIALALEEEQKPLTKEEEDAAKKEELDLLFHSST